MSDSDKMPYQGQVSGENRQSEVAVFRDRAERLHKRGAALMVIVRLLEDHPVSKEEEELLWSLAVGTRDF